MNKSSLLIFLILPFITSGCMSRIMMSPEDKSRISTISINENIEVNDKLFYAGPGATFGVIGLMVESTAKTEDKIKALASANDIHIDQMVKNEFIKALSNHHRLKLTDNATGDATLSINIKQYGLNIEHGFSDNLNAILVVVASLQDRNGKIIWQQHSQQGGDREAFKLKEFFDDPEKLRRCWTDEAAKVVGDILKAL